MLCCAERDSSPSSLEGRPGTLRMLALLSCFCPFKDRPWFDGPLGALPLVWSLEGVCLPLSARGTCLAAEWGPGRSEALYSPFPPSVPAQPRTLVIPRMFFLPPPTLPSPPTVGKGGAGIQAVWAGVQPGLL